MSWCKGCNARIEWHKTAEGKNIPIDPDPHPDGNVTFDAKLRVVVAEPGSKPKMYRSHFATCPKADKFRRRQPVTCEVDGCTESGWHRHCHRCQATDHLAADCPEG